MPIKKSEENLFMDAIKNTGAAIRYNRKIYMVLFAITVILFTGISVFAKEPRPVTMDDSLISEMNEKASAYENAQKKTKN